MATAHDFDGRALTGMSYVTTPSITVRGGTSNTFYSPPLVIYAQRLIYASPAGSGAFSLITIPANLMNTNGDQLVIDIEGGGSGTSNPRTISISVNGSTAQSIALTTSTGALFRCTIKVTRATVSTSDIILTMLHNTAMRTAGNYAVSHTTYASAGQIVLTTEVISINDVSVRSVSAIKYNVQS